ncbi:O-antigen ligase family protein [Tenacibaculum sp. nBUS_03]|uniref:O-antigen ligase family protein n=1 Tax=Tenacibaculum sp. nBUS_03 TaxID=3395320 RepID=UPI003EBFB78B
MSLEKMKYKESEFFNQKKTSNVDFLLLNLALALILTFFIYKLQIVGVALYAGLIISTFLIIYIFHNPKFGIIISLIASFFVTGLTRYVSVPWGLSIDFILVITYLSVFFNNFYKRSIWKKARSFVTTLISIWMLYILLQLINPETVSRAAWFYAMRGIALYQWLSIPLIFMLFNTPKDLDKFILIWGVLSILGSLKGITQLFIGVDPFEQRWLDGGGATTHVLFGKLRIFSFYSDAGQFGASQALSFVVFGILALYVKDKIVLKLFYISVSILGLYGMFISGTRGAISVPGMGGLLLLLLNKNKTTLAVGFFVAIAAYIFFAHTFIGQGNYQIRRMRTAFDGNDASLQVRLNNQKKLVGYLASRPFGGGVGATGNWGKRFTPNTFLANTATDSWYVTIWSDTGVVGLVYYSFMILSILITGMYNVLFKLKERNFRIKIMAITCGMAGILVASYGNGVFSQMPTGIIMYITIAFIVKAPQIEKKYLSIKKNKNVLQRY